MTIVDYHNYHSSRRPWFFQMLTVIIVSGWISRVSTCMTIIVVDSHNCQWLTLTSVTVADCQAFHKCHSGWLSLWLWSQIFFSTVYVTVDDCHKRHCNQVSLMKWQTCVAFSEVRPGHSHLRYQLLAMVSRELVLLIDGWNSGLLFSTATQQYRTVKSRAPISAILSTATQQYRTVKITSTDQCNLIYCNTAIQNSQNHEHWSMQSYLLQHSNTEQSKSRALINAIFSTATQQYRTVKITSTDQCNLLYCNTAIQNSQNHEHRSMQSYLLQHSNTEQSKSRALISAIISTATQQYRSQNHEHRSMQSYLLQHSNTEQSKSRALINAILSTATQQYRTVKITSTDQCNLIYCNKAIQNSQNHEHRSVQSYLLQHSNTEQSKSRAPISAILSTATQQYRTVKITSTDQCNLLYCNTAIQNSQNHEHRSVQSYLLQQSNTEQSKSRAPISAILSTATQQYRTVKITSTDQCNLLYCNTAIQNSQNHEHRSVQSYLLQQSNTEQSKSRAPISAILSTATQQYRTVKITSTDQCNLIYCNTAIQNSQNHEHWSMQSSLLQHSNTEQSKSRAPISAILSTATQQYRTVKITSTDQCNLLYCNTAIQNSQNHEHRSVQSSLLQHSNTEQSKSRAPINAILSTATQQYRTVKITSTD